jgi:opacity protein-like surface antigen
MKKLVLFLYFFISFINLSSAGLLPFGLGASVGVRGGTALNNEDLISTPNFIGVNADVELLGFRAELEYDYRIINRGSNFDSKMFNLYYNVISIPFIKFFVGGGVGNTELKGGLDDKFITYNYGLGATFSLAGILSLDAGYRRINFGGIIKNNTTVADDVYFGFRYGF